MPLPPDMPAAFQRLTYQQALTGFMRDDTHAAWMHVWRTATPRFSDLAHQYTDHPEPGTPAHALLNTWGAEPGEHCCAVAYSPERMMRDREE